MPKGFRCPRTALETIVVVATPSTEVLSPLDRLKDKKKVKDFNYDTPVAHSNSFRESENSIIQ